MPHINVEHLATAIDALQIVRKSWATVNDGDTPELRRLDAALAALQAPAQDGDYEPVPDDVRAYLVELCEYHHDSMQDTLDMMVKAYGEYDRDKLNLAICEKSLAWLRSLRRTSQPAGVEALDAPDSPGWWAWSDEYEHGVSEVYASDQELILSDEPGGLTPWHFSGRTWYRLHMPWERQRPGDAPGGEGGQP